MKFVTSREVRNNPSQFRQDVERDDVILTVGGKPFALAVGINEDEIEETLDILRRLRALRAMGRMQRTAEGRGVSGISSEEIDKEIREARKGRRPA
jgi:antitoxin (DNA-binding transcriptional repressor) of toxin-antitoxin stability system